MISDVGVIALAQSCSLLEVIYLNDCVGKAHKFATKRNGGVTDVGILALADNCPKLRSIGLSELPITDVGIVALASKCRITNWDINNMDANVPDDRKDGEGFTDVGLKAIAKYCPGTTVLNLCSDKLITDAGIVEIAANCPKLAKLTICCCDENKITATGKRAVAKLRPQLLQT